MSLLEIHTINRKLIDWRKNKIDIVFTNGCFDLLHQGHLDLLNKASTYGDILIVGLNSDSSVKKLKGEDRLYLETVYKTIKELELKDSKDYVPKNEYPLPDKIVKK